MTLHQLVKQLNNSLDSAQAAAQLVESHNSRQLTSQLLNSLRTATAAAQEIDNRMAGNKPKENTP